MVKRGNGVCLLFCMVAVLVPNVLIKPTEATTEGTPNAASNPTPNAANNAAPHNTTEAAPHNHTLVDLDPIANLPERFNLIGWNPEDPERKKILQELALHVIHVIRSANGINVNLTYKEEISKSSFRRAKYLTRKMMQDGEAFKIELYKPVPLFFSEFVGFRSVEMEDDELLKGMFTDLYISAKEEEEKARKKENILETAGKNHTAENKEETAGKNHTAENKEETAGKNHTAENKEETAGKNHTAENKEETAGNTENVTEFTEKAATFKTTQEKGKVINPVFLPQVVYMGLAFARKEVIEDDENVTHSVVVMDIATERQLAAYLIKADEEEKKWDEEEKKAEKEEKMWLEAKKKAAEEKKKALEEEKKAAEEKALEEKKAAEEKEKALEEKKAAEAKEKALEEEKKAPVDKEKALEQDKKAVEEKEKAPGDDKKAPVEDKKEEKKTPEEKPK